MEGEMCNWQDKEDAPKKEEEFLRQNMCAGHQACLRQGRTGFQSAVTDVQRSSKASTEAVMVSTVNIGRYAKRNGRDNLVLEKRDLRSTICKLSSHFWL